MFSFQYKKERNVWFRYSRFLLSGFCMFHLFPLFCLYLLLLFSKDGTDV